MNARLASALTATQWQELQAAAHWAEWFKYGRNATLAAQVGVPPADSYIGTNMLRLLAANMREVTGVTPHRLVLYSAHYPLLLGLFGALRLGDNAALRSGSLILMQRERGKTRKT